MIHLDLTGQKIKAFFFLTICTTLLVILLIGVGVFKVEFSQSVIELAESIAVNYFLMILISEGLWATGCAPLAFLLQNCLSPPMEFSS